MHTNESIIALEEAVDPKVKVRDSEEESGGDWL